MHEALGHGAAEGGAIRQRRSWLEWCGEEGDDPDEQEPPIGEREETRRQGKIHRPKGKTYL
jgi:hypothetical protein